MMQGIENDADDGDLEAELAAITGENVSAGKTKPKGKGKFVQKTRKIVLN